MQTQQTKDHQNHGFNRTRIAAIGLTLFVASSAWGAPSGVAPRGQVSLPPGTVSPQAPNVAVPNVAIPKTQPNWSVQTRSVHNAQNRPVAPGASAPVVIEVSNTREGTLNRAIRLVVGNKAHGNYRDFGTFSLTRKGTKRVFNAALKIPANAADGWYKTNARLLETNGTALKDYHGTNVANVTLSVAAPKPKPDPAPKPVAGALYDWSADTQACSTSASFISDAWNYMDDVLGVVCTGVQVGSDPTKLNDLGKTFRQCTANASKYTSAVNKGVSEYNKLVSNSWATLGPRALRYGIDSKGTVLFPGNRTFISVVPARKDTVKLRLREISGKAQTEVIVCRKGQKGQVQRLNKRIIFNYSNRATHQVPNQDESFILGGVRDKFVTVILKTKHNGHLKVTNVVPKMQYVLRVSEHQ